MCKIGGWCMNHSIKILNLSDISKDDWTIFLQSNKHQSTVFHTYEWMTSLQEAFGYGPKVIVMGVEQYFIAAMPFMIDTRYRIKNYFSMPFDTYGGAIGDVDSIPILLQHFHDLPGIGMRYYVDYNNVYDCSYLFDKIETSTHLLDISPSLDDILKKIDKRKQKLILSLLKNKDISCRIATTSEDLDIVKNLLKPNEEIHGDGVDPKLVDAIYKYMVPAGYCKPYLTTVSDIPVCGSLFFVYNDMAIYWQMALNNYGRKTHAHYKLVWQAIYDLKVMRGIKTLNMGATPSVTNTVDPWKELWGSRKKSYYLYKKVPTLLKPILKIKEAIPCD
jgi:hypothetical protein